MKMISEVALRDYPDYEAISYAWGDPNEMIIVQVNQRAFAVRKNLNSALRHLILASSDRLLWVDAICINQNDIGEKEHQVSQMHTVYFAAGKVIIWLGEGNKSSDRAMNLVKEASLIAVSNFRTTWNLNINSSNA